MLRRLVNNQTKFLLYSKSMAKISELKEYACLRESLNEEASAKAHQEYQRLCEQYNLSREALTDLFKIINSEPELLKEFVTYESWLQDHEHLKDVWIKSPFFASGQTVQGSVEALKRKYPEVANYDTRHSERVKAYQTLENIFIKDGPTLKNNYDNKAVSRYLNEFQKRINGHLNELRTKNQNKTAESPHGDGTRLDSVEEIAKTLGAIYSKIQQDPAYVYGRIRHFLTVHKQQLGEIQPRDTTSQIVTAKSLEENAIRRTAASDVADPLQEGNDVPAMIEEENNALRQSLNYNFLPWINDRKIIFEAQAARSNTFIYGALASVFGSYLLYKLYQGDATYTGLAVILAATAFSFGRHRIGTIRNSFDYLVQMNIHRDGRTLDLFIQKPNNTVAKIEGVPVSDFKLHRGDYTFELPENPTGQLYAQLSGKGSSVKLSDIRKIGVGSRNWVATYGGDNVFVPMQYTGNSSILREVFKGKGLDA